VLGLNFDFLALNLLGFSCYSMFNCVFYWSPVVAAEFYTQNPTSELPVQLNDIAFAVHAVFVTLVTIGQCMIYEVVDTGLFVGAPCSPSPTLLSYNFRVKDLVGLHRMWS
jgi:hypothetical protein